MASCTPVHWRMLEALCDAPTLPSCPAVEPWAVHLVHYDSCKVMWPNTSTHECWVSDSIFVCVHMFPAVERWAGWFVIAAFAGILMWEQVWDLPGHAALSGACTGAERFPFDCTIALACCISICMCMWAGSMHPEPVHVRILQLRAHHTLVGVQACVNTERVLRDHFMRTCMFLQVGCWC
jgi:hypothetical protein